MKNFILAMRSTRKDLVILLCIGIALYFSIELYFTNISPLFYGAYELGQFISKISIAYITGFIFYFIVVHLKSVKDKEHINEYVGNEVFGIIINGHLLIQPLMQKSNKHAFYKHLNSLELSGLLSKIDPLAKEAPMILNGLNITWLDWYADQIQSTKQHIYNIFQRSSFLEPELIKLVTRIENSIFIDQFGFLISEAKEHMLVVYQPQIEMHLNLIDELEDYANKYLAQYRYLSGSFAGWKENGR